MDYWANSEASYNGVLGGFGSLSGVDVRDSLAFLDKLLHVELAEQAAGKRRLRVVDCGAGVGRVTKELLIHKFADVDLVSIWLIAPGLARRGEGASAGTPSTRTTLLPTRSWSR